MDDREQIVAIPATNESISLSMQPLSSATTLLGNQETPRGTKLRGRCMGSLGKNGRGVAGGGVQGADFTLRLKDTGR